MTPERTDEVVVVGSGYVGTVVAAGFAVAGHRVVGLETDREKLASLQVGRAPFYEPGLDDLLADQLDRGSLRFTDDYERALRSSRSLFLCVGTPTGSGGQADMTWVEEAAMAIGRHAGGKELLLITKSTVPIGSGRWLRTVVEDASQRRPNVTIVSNPEFLREGSAIRDFLHPERVVLGSDSIGARTAASDMYRPILDQTIPGGRPEKRPVLVLTDQVTAEMIKYAANAFLAMKISFINEMAQISDAVGADVGLVARALGLDDRIGPRFLGAGIGWGGSCFGKDIAALGATAREHGIEPRLLDAVAAVNRSQIDVVIAKLQENLKSLRGRRVAVLGLAFKPGTDDLRDAPSIKLIGRLLELGCTVSAHDPVVDALPSLPDVRVAPTMLEAVDRVDAVVIVTEWRDYVEADLHAFREVMDGNTIIDGRNALDRERAIAAGFVYRGIGR